MSDGSADRFNLVIGGGRGHDRDSSAAQESTTPLDRARQVARLLPALLKGRHDLVDVARRVTDETALLGIEVHVGTFRSEHADMELPLIALLDEACVLVGVLDPLGEDDTMELLRPDVPYPRERS